ncbi:MAG: T9SS type A sorting domain-containing protein, partial [Bacteroidia bacterium]|nr:T9SS type A sorting domain-containing protein [Bacteroidia bacterium]
MKTISPFKFIITIVMVIFSTTVNSQSAQINSITDFSDYNQSIISATNYINIISSQPYGFEFFDGAQRAGAFTKSYPLQSLDSVKISFKVTSTFLLNNNGAGGFKIGIGAATFTPIFSEYYMAEIDNHSETFIRSHTFINGDSVLFSNVEIRLLNSHSSGLGLGGTITIDSLVIIGYKQSGTIWTENSTVGIEENIDNVTNFNTYPNPNNGEFNILFESKLISSPIKIYDTQGRMIYENHDLRQIGENTLNIQLENISPGIYSLNSGEKTYKIV